IFKMPRGGGYLSRGDYAQRTRDKVILLDDMMPRFGAPRATSHNLSSLDSGNDIVAQVNSGGLAINGGVDVSRISRRKGVYYYSREEDYPEYLPSDPELFTFIQNFVPSHMTADDLCLSVERRYLESAILKSRDGLLGTCAFSYPSFPLGFAIQHRLPRACSSAPTEVYIPAPVEESVAAAGVPFGQEFYEQLFMSGTIDMYPTLAADPFFSPWGNAGNSYLAGQVHSAFQVDGVRGYGGGYQEADAPMDHNVNLPILPPSDFGSHPVDHPSRSQRFYSGEPDFVQPPNPEAVVKGSPRQVRRDEGSNALLDFFLICFYGMPVDILADLANSPALVAIGAPLEHNITWPTRDRPDLSSDDEDSGIWNCLTAKVQAMVTSANPPSVEVMRRILARYTIRAFNMGICRDRWMGFVKDTWDKVYCLHDNATQAPYSQRLQTLECDICSLSSDIDESDSRAADVRKRRKIRELRMATRGENIARLERELGKERSSQAQDARDEARDSEEEAVFIRDGDGSRRIRLWDFLDIIYHDGLPVELRGFELANPELLNISFASMLSIAQLTMIIFT
ncbi:hypothetical protein Taro_010392, partial [Colocasia esculenta]|nr:hypothetical protein [Colocasia esculenta]